MQHHPTTDWISLVRAGFWIGVGLAMCGLILSLIGGIFWIAFLLMLAR